MAELSGSLSSIELAPLVQFLCGLGKSGDLLISRAHWVGHLSFECGQLIGAAVETDSGPTALEFVAAGLCGGDFEFSEGPPGLPRNLGPDSLAYLAGACGAPGQPRLFSIPEDRKS